MEFRLKVNSATRWLITFVVLGVLTVLLQILRVKPWALASGLGAALSFVLALFFALKDVREADVRREEEWRAANLREAIRLNSLLPGPDKDQQIHEWLQRTTGATHPKRPT